MEAKRNNPNTFITFPSTIFPFPFLATPFFCHAMPSPPATLHHTLSRSALVHHARPRPSPPLLALART
ncbi:hypothetical protein E2C01_083347 [Portunus trituberculatus]|uniref:Uncharacterized protein n=1 Tax=Portunus trituberculatus TaxID=210409 RepID=A0A5B7J7K5_PORTR|nr:hypothetical protein [Portunus trituberculatus]